MYDVYDVPESPDVEFTSVWATKSRQNPSTYVSQSAGSGSVGSFSSSTSNDKVRAFHMTTVLLAIFRVILA